MNRTSHCHSHYVSVNNTKRTNEPDLRSNGVCQPSMALEMKTLCRQRLPSFPRPPARRPNPRHHVQYSTQQHPSHQGVSCGVGDSGGGNNTLLITNYREDRHTPLSVVVPGSLWKPHPETRQPSLDNVHGCAVQTRKLSPSSSLPSSPLLLLLLLLWKISTATMLVCVGLSLRPLLSVALCSSSLAKSHLIENCFPPPAFTTATTDNDCFYYNNNI